MLESEGLAAVGSEPERGRGLDGAGVDVEVYVFNIGHITPSQSLTISYRNREVSSEMI